MSLAAQAAPRVSGRRSGPHGGRWRPVSGRGWAGGGRRWPTGPYAVITPEAGGQGVGGQVGGGLRTLELLLNEVSWAAMTVILLRLREENDEEC